METFIPNKVKVGIIRTGGIYQSPCFDHLCATLPQFTMSDVMFQCSEPLGLSIDLLLVVIDVLNLPYTRLIFLPQTHSDYGTFNNGSWTGLVKGITDGEFDTTIPEVTPTQKRLSVVHFSDPIANYPVEFTTRYVEAFAECKNTTFRFLPGNFQHNGIFQFFCDESILPSVWILLINFGDRRTRNAGDISANLKFVMCSQFCRFVEM